ncbi:MAG: PcfJ domain-containing protein [Bryobacteraceae bacterium]|jgi:hypothetical protein
MLGNESILEVDYRIEGGALYRYHAKVVERIVPWGSEAAACRMTAGAWQAFIPEVEISSLEATVERPGRSRLPGWLRRVDACRFLIGRWPEEARDAVRRFPSAHWQLLQFVNTGGPPALELLRSNPALGYLAATGDAAHQIGLRRRSLAALFGFPETEHAVHVLRKVPRAWISREFLGQLRAVMVEEREADAVLTHLARVNPIALEVARDAALRGWIAPECIAHLSRVPVASQCDLIARMRDLQESARDRGLTLPRMRALADLDRPVRRARGPARPAPLNEAVALAAPGPRDIATPPTVPPPPPIRTVPDLDRPLTPAQVRLTAPPRRTRDPLAFPKPPLPDLVAEGLRILAIRSRGDLVAESDAMHHCAGRDKSYARRVANGRLYFYRMIEPERLTIAIRPERSRWGVDRWIVEEIRGIGNRQPSDLARGLIWNWMRECRAPSFGTTGLLNFPV